MPAPQPSDRIICRAVDPSERFGVAEFVYDAFSTSLSRFLPDRDSRLRIIAEGFDLGASTGGFVGDRLLGAVGKKTWQRSVYDGISNRLLWQEAGLGVLKAKFALAILDSSVEAHSVRNEFLAVHSSARGRGVGAALL